MLSIPSQPGQEMFLNFPQTDLFPTDSQLCTELHRIIIKSAFSKIIDNSQLRVIMNMNYWITKLVTPYYKK